MTFAQAFGHPFRIHLNATFPAIIEAADLGLVAPNDFIMPVGKEGRIEVNEIDRFGLDFFAKTSRQSPQ
jgi:hypothetical protein